MPRVSLNGLFQARRYVDVFATGRQGVRDRSVMIPTSVALSAGTVGVVVGLVATATMVATRVPATASGAEVFLRWAKNALTWVAIFAVVFLVGRLMNGSRRRRERR